MSTSEEYVRLGWHLVPIDLPTEKVRIGTLANTPREILLNDNVRIGQFQLTPELFSKRPRIQTTNINAQVNTALSYQIQATNNPTSYSATGLPAGLSINTTTGLITGTPTTEGTSSVTITATNDEGTGTRTITIRVGDVPAISSTSASGIVNTAFSYQVIASGGPFTGFSATGLPAGLSINSSGLITGRVTTTGTTTAQITATNVFGTSASQPLSISITAAIVGNPAFYGPLPTGTTVAELREPDFIITLPTSPNPALGTVMTVPLPNGAQGVLFAFPATLGAGTTAFQNPPGFDVITGLPNETIALQPGGPASTPINYTVRYQRVATPYTPGITFVFTI